MSDQERNVLAELLPRPRNIIRDDESIVQFCSGDHPVAEINFTRLLSPLFERLFGWVAPIKEQS